MTEDGRRGTRAVAVLLGLAGLAGAVWALLPRMLGAAGGPEPELVAALRTAELAHAPIPVPGGPAFEPRTLRFDRFSVTVDADRAAVVATLDAAGTSGGVEVSSLGRERVRFLRRGGRWEPDGPLAPSLSAALALLWHRAGLLSGSSAEALGVLVAPTDRGRSVADARIDSVLRLAGHRWEPRAWYLRSEREAVLVTEEAILTSTTRDPEPRTGRLRLRSSGDAGVFVFDGALL
ncbi:MAG TPA: hypothetical protein VLT82_06590 [Myxococcaceae bacterium]|nr:hypothetical protein [Myxococcaceae bacterium]